jgi:uncharacterized protein (DUF697 family)
MKRDSLLTIYDRFFRLVEKLPGGLQKPILRELTPIRQIYLEQRPARLMLLGHPLPSGLEFLGRLCDHPVMVGGSANGWRTYEIPGRGAVQILDAREESPRSYVETALNHELPDAIIFLEGPGSLEEAAIRLENCPESVPLFGVPATDDPTIFLSQLAKQPLLSARGVTLRSLAKLPEALCVALPNPAKLEFARLTGARDAQAHIATSLLKSFAAICGVIGLQPIPLADLPILTALQTLMVGLIIRTAGRPVTPRLIGEFVGALGFNIGAGMLFREGARAVIKVVPIWGHAVSGFIAGAGTYAIGRAAIAYFIEGIPLPEVKKVFSRFLPRRKPPEIKNS